MNVVRSVYNRVIRPHIPRKYAVYNGVPARDAALLDLTDTFPDYKEGLISAIHEFVRVGDGVTLVGGGRGVSTVHCLRAGASCVTVYEAAADMLPLFSETIANADSLLEDSTDRVTLHHALVGDAIDIYGELGEAELIEPLDLPTEDVLILDVEGAETSILDGLTDAPRVTILETHPDKGAPESNSRQLLTDLGYDVTSRPYEPDQNEKSVLVGTTNSELAEMP